MKKVLALAIALIIITSLAACSGTQAPSGNENTTSNSQAEQQSNNDASKSGSIATPAEFSEYIKAFIDLNHYTPSNPDDTHCGFSLNTDFYPNYKDSKNVHLLNDENVVLDGGTKICLGMQMTEFSHQGWSFKEESAAGKELKPNVEGNADLVYTGKEIDATIRNNTEKEIKYSEGIVRGFSFELFDKDSNYTQPLKTAVVYSIDGKVNNTSGLKNVIEAFGEPYHIFYGITRAGTDKAFARIELEYKDQYDNGEHTMMIVCSGDGSKVVEVNFTADR